MDQSNHGQGLKVLLYSHDSFGLGHLRRTVTIAHRLAHLDGSASLLCVTGSPEAGIFPSPPGFDYVKIPSVTKDDQGSYVSRDLPGSLKDVVKIRSMAIESLLESYEPDVVLVDHTPGGLGGELIPGLRSYRKSHPQARTVIGLRDIIDSPAKTRIQLMRDGSYALLDELYDEILVYGHEHILDLGEEYALPASLRQKLDYVGAVCPFCDDCPEPSCAAPVMAPKPNKQILVCAGGGADGAPLLRAVSEALRHSSLPFDFDATFVTGPFLDDSTCRELEGVARHDPRIDFRRCEKDMARAVAQSDLILAMGGYNSVYEALCMRKRLLIHPRSYPREEQLERAQRLASLGLVGILTSEQLSSPNTLRNCIVEALDADVVDARSKGISFSGACEAARRILQIESSGHRSASAGIR